MPTVTHRFTVADDVESDRTVVSVQGVDVVFGASDEDSASIDADTQPGADAGSAYETDDADRAALLSKVSVLDHTVVIDGQELAADDPKVNEVLAAAYAAEVERAEGSTAQTEAARQREVAEARELDDAPDGNAAGDTSQAGETVNPYDDQESQ